MYTELESIVLPDSVTDLKYEAFYGCRSLKSAVLGKNITQIAASTFEYCVELESLTIPVSVTRLYFDAIHGCQKLTDIYYKGTTSDWENITKDYDWDEYTEAYTIHCANGDIAKS